MAAYRRVRNAANVMGYARQIPFSFVIPLVAPAGGIAAGASVSNSIQTDPGLPFILTELGGTYTLDITATTAFENRLTFTMVDGESQQMFSNAPVPRERMFGTRDFPRQLPEEAIITPADQITVTMANGTGGVIAAGTTFFAVLTGYKLVGWRQDQPE